MESCDLYSILNEPVAAPEAVIPSPKVVIPSNAVSQKLIRKLLEAYKQAKKDEEGWVSVGLLRQNAKIPDSKFTKFSKLVANSQLFELSDNNSQARLLSK